jgi:hypothetical protein
VPLKRFREKIFSTTQKTFTNLLVSISQGSIMGGQNKRRQKAKKREMEKRWEISNNWFTGLWGRQVQNW